MPTITLDHATTLHYTERGTGTQPAIVLLHGFPLDSRVWQGVIDVLPPGTRVIAPDLRGFGQSTSEQPFTIESLADDIHRFLTQLKVGPVVLGGLSMGGYVALAYAKKFPMHLSGLMLIDTKAEGDTAEGKEKRNKMIAMVRERGAAASAAVAAQMMPNMIAESSARNEALVSSLRAIMESCPARTIESAVVAMRDRPDQMDFLPSIAIPTLIIVGERDAITPKSAAETMHRAIPRSKLVVIPDSGHMTPMEKPAEVGHAIASFTATLQS